MPSTEQTRTLKFGDMIQFEAPTRLDRKSKTVWRMVTGWTRENPTVRFYGNNSFVVKLSEIQAVQT